jgi:hypothetical protein
MQKDMVLLQEIILMQKEIILMQSLVLTQKDLALWRADKDSTYRENTIAIMELQKLQMPEILLMLLEMELQIQIDETFIHWIGVVMLGLQGMYILVPLLEHKKMKVVSA